MDITAQIITDFRDYYPEFADDTAWTEGFLTRFLCEGDEETGSRWGSYDDGNCSLKKRGMFSYAAHKAVVGKAAATATQAGGIASALSRANSKSVGDESIGYAVSSPESGSAQDQRGDLDGTIYGQEFLRLRIRAGMGAVVV